MRSISARGCGGCGPDIVFGADLIAGFPTETDAMFENTLAPRRGVRADLSARLSVFARGPARPPRKCPPSRGRSSRSGRGACARPARRRSGSITPGRSAGAARAHRARRPWPRRRFHLRRNRWRAARPDARRRDRAGRGQDAGRNRSERGSDARPASPVARNLPSAHKGVCEDACQTDSFLLCAILAGAIFGEWSR